LLFDNFKIRRHKKDTFAQEGLILF